jgi:hypothetical protein
VAELPFSLFLEVRLLMGRSGPWGLVGSMPSLSWAPSLDSGDL